MGWSVRRLHIRGDFLADDHFTALELDVDEEGLAEPPRAHEEKEIRPLFELS